MSIKRLNISLKGKCLHIKRREIYSQRKNVICHFKIVNELQILFDDEKEYDIHKKALMKYKIIIDNEVLFSEYAVSNCWIFLLVKIINILRTLCVYKAILNNSYKF